MSTEYGQRLRAARELKGWTQGQLSKATGIAQSTISTAERKGHGSTETVAYAMATGVNPVWLATGEGEMIEYAHALGVKQTGNSPPIYQLESNVSEIPKRPRVPLISMIHAGEMTDVFNPFHPGEAVVWVEPHCTNPSAQAYALKVEGDSMESQIPGAMSILEGSILIVDPNACAGPNDYVIAKDIDTQKANFRQLKTDGVRWYLKPLNSVYPIVEIDDPALRVIGRVMEIQPPVIRV